MTWRCANICGQAGIYSGEVQDTEKRYIKFPVNWLKSIDPDEEALIEKEVWTRVEEGGDAA